MRLSLAFVLFGVVPVAHLAGQQPPQTGDVFTATGSTQIQYVREGTPSVWSAGAFLAVERAHSAAPVFRAFDRTGNQVSEFTLTLPGASLINVSSYRFARGYDGSLAVVGSAFTDDERGGVFLAWVSATGHERTWVRLNPLAFPDAVAVASDGAIWVATPSLVDRVPDDHHVIWRFSRAGKMLGSFVPLSTLGPGPRSRTSPSYLVSAPDRIGWYSKGARKYIEFALDGTVLDRFDAVPDEKNNSVLGFALCDDGRFFVSGELFDSTGKTTAWGIYTLDRQLRTWEFTPMGGRWGFLYGCDGITLASTSTSSDSTIVWLQPAAK